jgi:hypothetical protein
MKEYITTSTIDAPPETVWAVLTDGASYREWNPEIVGVDGPIAEGARIAAHVRLGDGDVREVPQRVTTLAAPTRMEWKGGLPLGLFVGHRTFTVQRVGDKTEFCMHLRMSGPLSPLILNSVGDRQPEIDAFSAALKRRAEREVGRGGDAS